MRCLLTLLLLVGCSQSHSNDVPACDSMGGWCQTPDLPCGEGAWFAGSLCEREYDVCCVPEPAVDAGVTPCIPEPVDREMELCEQLCHPDRCGFPFQSPVDDCLEHCLSTIPECDDEAITQLETCVPYCDSFVPCVYDVTCIQP